jgi:hypothetical protein
LLMLEARVKDIPKFEAGFDNCVIPGPIFWEYPHPWTSPYMYFENAKAHPLCSLFLKYDDSRKLLFNAGSRFGRSAVGSVGLHDPHPLVNIHYKCKSTSYNILATNAENVRPIWQPKIKLLEVPNHIQIEWHRTIFEVRNHIQVEWHMTIFEVPNHIQIEWHMTIFVSHVNCWNFPVTKK